MGQFEILKIFDKFNNLFIFRLLTSDDSYKLTNFFESLSSITKLRFGPHPLTPEYANYICNLHQDSAQRFVIIDNLNHTIVGYFILEFNIPDYEILRYKSYNIDIKPLQDASFAPCVADEYQNRGLASMALSLIINKAKNKGAISIVLMGGVQESNSLALNFYSRSGFSRVGGYQTDIYNVDMRLEIAP